MTKNRVVIIDDEEDIRDGLHDLLVDEYEVCCFDSAEDFLDSYNDFEFCDGTPTCVLLDFQMPEMNGVELQACLKSMNSNLPIIFMSGNAVQSDVIAAWRGGATDFLLKPISGADVSIELKKVFERLKAQRTDAKGKEIEELPITTREAQVLLLLAKGMQQNEVAQELKISLSTIKMYRTFIKNKLQLTNPIELVRYCDEHRASIEAIAIK